MPKYVANDGSVFGYEEERDGYNEALRELAEDQEREPEVEQCRECGEPKYVGYDCDNCKKITEKKKGEVMTLQIERTDVESSQIKSIGYNAIEGKMDIEFNSGSVYRYSLVTEEIYFKFMDAESKGKFFFRHIKKFPDKFPFEKIRGTHKQERKKELMKDHQQGGLT